MIDLASRAAWQRGEALIAGRWAAVEDAIEVENPATEEAIGTAAACGPEEVDRAVAAARAAAPAWAATPPAERSAALRALHGSLISRREELVAATVGEVGAPLRVTVDWHVDIALEIVANLADEVTSFPFCERLGRSRVIHEPAGVVGAILPWNYPLYQLVAKLAPALAAGCTVVAKPAELAPLTACIAGDAVIASGIPPGVVNLVPGSGAVAGDALVCHPDVDLVSFTGSTAVGAQVAAAASARIARVCLELGGKSASVVLDDADLERAVRATVDSATVNSGQTCSAWTRLLVPEEALGEALEVAVDHAEGLVVGDPREETTDLGPLISARQRETVRGFLARAEAAGAELVSGGGERSPGLACGHYVAPAIVAGADPQSEIVQEEVFGPVLCILGCRDEDEAVALANGTRYGLSGAVWSGDEERALAVAARLRTGQVDINGAPFNARAPFGGVGDSGSGRELGPYGLAELCSLKAVQL